VVNTFDLPPTHLGVLSYEDVNKFLDQFLKTIYDIAKEHHSRKIKISEIENSMSPTFGRQAVYQVVEFLKMKGLVEPGENENEIQIPSINTKKSYEVPSARFSQF
jgi:sulfatase maturation enzyme AslB (radical SAM superfamily)